MHESDTRAGINKSPPPNNATLVLLHLPSEYYLPATCVATMTQLHLFPRYSIRATTSNFGAIAP